MSIYLDAYVVLRQGQKIFTFGSLQADISMDNDFITKFKNPKFSKLKELKSETAIVNCIQTPETYLPVAEAIEMLCNPDPVFVKKRAVARLKKALNAKGIWIDIATSSIE